jgi:hypothetical protein
VAWTYSEDPDSSPKDLVRFLIGDTDKEEPLLHDAEINSLLKSYNGSTFMTAIRCCETLAAKFSRRVDESVGQVKMTFSQAAKSYRDMAIDLRRRMAIETVSPTAGGISRLGKIQQDLNPDRVRPDFSKEMMGNGSIAPLTSQGRNTDPLQDDECD